MPQKKLNIFIIASGYPSRNYPYATFIAALAEEMCRQNVSVSVIARQSMTWHILNHVPFQPYYSTQEINGKIIQIYRPIGLTDNGRLGPFARWINRRKVNKILRSLPRPDAVYAHFWLNAVCAIDYIKETHLPFIVATGEDQIPDAAINKKDKNWLQSNVGQVVCVSTKNKEESISLGLTTEDCCAVLPNAYNPAEFYQEDGTFMRKQLGIADDDFVIAFCGRFNHRKGIFRLDAALKQLNDPHIKAIYIGSPIDNCKEEPNYERIAFKGSLAHNLIVHYLNAADVFVLPSVAEGCPNSVIEAMACGLPIISSDLPFNYDILDNQNSILLDPLDIGAIAQAINTLKKDGVLYKQLSDNAIQKAKTLQLDNRVTKILQLIKNLLPESVTNS